MKEPNEGGPRQWRDTLRASVTCPLYPTLNSAKARLSAEHFTVEGIITNLISHTLHLATSSLKDSVMAKWADLPTELVSDILSLLPRAIHLKVASLVCSQLRHPAQRLLKQCIIIGGDSTETARCKSLSKLVEYKPTERVDPRQQLLSLVRALRRHPKSFENVRTLKLQVNVKHGETGWVQTETPDRRRDVFEDMVELVRAMGGEDENIRLLTTQDLARAAFSIRISNALLHSAPLSTALLVVLHLIPTIRHLVVFNIVRTLLPTLALATHGSERTGGVPLCLQALHSLTLTAYSGTLAAVPPPIPLLLALPSLQSFRCSRWFPQRSTQKQASQHSRLSHFASPGGLDEYSIIQILSFSASLEHIELEIRPYYRARSDALLASAFDNRAEKWKCEAAALSKALKPRSHSLRSLAIHRANTIAASYKLKTKQYDYGTLGRLDAFTSLPSFAGPAWMLFGKLSHLSGDPESLFTMYLPPSLEHLHLLFDDKSDLYETAERFCLQRLWPVIRAKSFPKLSKFYFYCESSLQPRDDKFTLEEEWYGTLASVGIVERTPQRYVVSA